jgi:hypothetical protein
MVDLSFGAGRVRGVSLRDTPVNPSLGGSAPAIHGWRRSRRETPRTLLQTPEHAVRIESGSQCIGHAGRLALKSSKGIERRYQGQQAGAVSGGCFRDRLWPWMARAEPYRDVHAGVSRKQPPLADPFTQAQGQTSTSKAPKNRPNGEEPWN